VGAVAVVVPATDKPTRVRCSLRYAETPGSGPTLIGWPFAWICLDADTITCSAGRLVPFGRPRWTVPRSAITKVERTGGGIRIFCNSLTDPWIVGSLFPNHLIKKLSEAGFEIPEDPVVPTGWDSL
jgi:hypothetical protein